MTSHQRAIEREFNRIMHISKNNIYNPLDILYLSLPFVRKEFKLHYKNILLLIHPDKTYNLNRFNEAFHIVNHSYKTLNDNHKRLLCIKAKKKNNVYLLSSLFDEDTIIISSKTTIPINKSFTKKEIAIWQNNQQLSTHLNNYFDPNPQNIIINIAVNGAEHTTNKSKSKKGKHDKGLRQRVIQIRNAKRRIHNHNFSFRPFFID